MTKLERLAAIVMLLQVGPRTSAQLAAQFEVGKRTVLRDMQALSEMGVPVIATEGIHGGYALPDDYRIAPLPLDANEVLLLLLALEHLNQLADAPHAAARHSLTRKLRSQLPKAQAANAGRALSHIRIGAPARAERAPALDAVLAAAQAGRWLNVRYASARGERDVLLFPRRVWLQGGLWYVTAFAHAHEEDRVYRIDRMLVCAPAPEQPPPPPAELPYDDPAHPEIYATLTRAGVGLIALDADVGPVVQALPDGGGTLRLRCPPSELAYFARLFAMLGEDAIVHTPPDLCARIAQLGAQLAARYRA